MRRVNGFIFCLVILTLICSAARAENVKILLLMSNNYGANHYLDRDNFEEFGWDVTTAGLSQTVSPCPLYAGPLGCPPIIVDFHVLEITDITQYDVLALMPVSWRAGNPHSDLLGSPETLDLIAEAVDSGLVVYAHCSGPIVLAAAGVLEGVNITGRPEYQAEYLAGGANYLGSNVLPVIDGNIVTSTRGMYYHEANCQAIATALENNQIRNIQDDDKETGDEEEK
ncbi:MAG: DJ-1/PfpI family protein [candidate division Zixibacteria bacterium]|nr:DJ-1/PfpI family protein [candidate division Zixibacteria bacterium]